MMSENLVSLIVICYNQEKYLEKAFNSVVSQTYKPLEVIIVDNASTDKTPEIIKTFVERYNWKSIFHQKNNGPAGARNAGIAVSQGEYICFLDGDDLIEPTKVAFQVGKFLSHSEIDIIYTGTRIIDEQDNLLQIVPVKSYSPEDFRVLMYIRNIVPAPASLMFRRKIFTHGFRYDERYTRCEDYELMLRLIKQYNFYGLDEPLYYYRRHSKNSSNYHSLDKQVEVEIIKEILFGEVEQAAAASTFEIERKNILLGQFMMKQGKFREALKYFERNLDHKSIWYRGNCYFLMNDSNSALHYYLKITIPFPELLNNLGVVYKINGNLDKAKTCFEEASRLNTNYSDPVRNQKYLKGSDHFFTTFELRQNLTLYQKIN